VNRPSAECLGTDSHFDHSRILELEDCNHPAQLLARSRQQAAGSITRLSILPIVISAVDQQLEQQIVQRLVRYHNS
jgi:hypothetical protein